ncbi:MAG: hypothetical protein C6Y20_10425 [Tagaea sp. CACIAM 22H2]|nr:hypothetical protein [Tagaea sp. CACIAM 22H2]
MTSSFEKITRRNAVRIVGSGQHDVLFAHGFGCAKSMWRFVAPEIARYHRTILFDYVGMGEAQASEYDATRYSSLDGYAQDLLEVARSAGDKPKIVIGHSVSSTIGVLAALREPKMVAGIVMLCPSPCFLNDDLYRGGFTVDAVNSLIDYLEVNRFEWGRQLSVMASGGSSINNVFGELEENFCRLDPRIARDFARLTFLADNRAEFKRFNLPTLIIHCKKDTLASSFVGQWVHEAIVGSQYIELDAPGHCPHMTNSSETVSAILKFLADFPNA